MMNVPLSSDFYYVAENNIILEKYIVYFFIYSYRICKCICFGVIVKYLMNFVVVWPS